MELPSALLHLLAVDELTYRLQNVSTMGQTTRSQLSPKQLSMVFQAAEVGSLPGIELPRGYELRAFQQGDEESWAKTLNLGGFTNWNAPKVMRYLEDPERRVGSCVVAHAADIVSATFASRASYRGAALSTLPSDPSNEGVVDYVVTRPDHQGKGLGRATTVCVTKFLIARGCETVSLSTDEWRLPAIHIYLSLGFKPVMNREDMPGRWEVVLNKLEEGGRGYS